MKKKIHVWHLEILDPSPVPRHRERHWRLEVATDPAPEFARYLYMTVGAPWTWYMRLGWTWREWQRRFEDDRVELWVGYEGASPIGYFELERQSPDSAQICYFGLVPDFIGKGYGGPFLEDAIDKARSLGGGRVWLHTCTLDHPNALSNYLRRGFGVFNEEDVTDNIPDEPIQPWPGANRPPVT